jgi:hypothetical protein
MPLSQSGSTMTTQPMPLEETKDLLMQLRNEAVRERDSNAKKRDKALSSLEKALYGEGFAGWDEHVRILDSTLHHLEAGKRDACSCDAFQAAQRSGTDNEAYGSLAYRWDGEIRMGCDLPPITFCPWCGGSLKTTAEEPQG